MILKILGWCAVGYVAYTCVKDGGIVAGLNDVEAQIKSLFAKPTTALAPTTVTVNTPKAAITVSAPIPTCTPAELECRLDWGIKPISTSANNFTPAGRAANSSWCTIL